MWLENCNFSESNFRVYERLTSRSDARYCTQVNHTLIELTKFYYANCWLFNESREETLLQCQAIERPKRNLNQRTLRDKFGLSHQKLFRRKLIAVANATNSTVENIKKLISMQTPSKPGWNIKRGLQPRVTTGRFLNNFFSIKTQKRQSEGNVDYPTWIHECQPIEMPSLYPMVIPKQTFQNDRKTGSI